MTDPDIATPAGSPVSARGREGDILRVDVCIVGGGMVGTSLAAALGGAGVRVALVDRSDPAEMVAAEFDGRSSAIAHGSRTALDGIGLWAGIAPAAEPIRNLP